MRVVSTVWQRWDCLEGDKTILLHAPVELEYVPATQSAQVDTPVERMLTQAKPDPASIVDPQKPHHSLPYRARMHAYKAHRGPTTLSKS